MKSSKTGIIIRFFVRFPATNEMVVIKRINANSVNGPGVFLAEKKDICGPFDLVAFGLDTVDAVAEVTVHTEAILRQNFYR